MKLSDIKVSYVQHCGDDLSVANAARVSFHKESAYDWYDVDGRGPADEPSPCGEYFNIPKIKEQDAKLINYLAKHKHFSPFNHSFITLRVKAPVFVARQLVKHKFMPWNEVSRRYVDEEPEFYFSKYWRAKAENVKQGSSDTQIELLLDNGWSEGGVIETPHKMTDVAVQVYLEMVNQGVCPEQARMILPQNMMTEWWWSGTLGAYCDMLRLRLDSHTQQETREVANRAYQIIKPLFPISVKALLG